MYYSQAKEALNQICRLPDKGEKEKIKKIIDEHPSLINEVMDSEGSTALILGTKSNDIELIKLLLSKDNIDINIQTKNGSTALHCASRNCQKDIVEVLLSQDNIDINIQTKDGWTALHCASRNGHKDIVEVLLSQDNIDMNLQTKVGKLAIDLCCGSSLANKSSKSIILELFMIHSTLKPSGRSTLSSVTMSTSLIDSTERPDKDLSLKSQGADAKGVDEVKERDLLTVVEENKSLKLQVQSLEEKIREMTNNTMKERERNLLEKENLIKEMNQMNNNNSNEMERKLQEKEESMKLTVNNLVTRLVAEKEKEYDELRGQIERMETLLNQMESCKKELERQFEEEPLPLPPNKQTHVFLTHTWRDDEKGRNNHNRVGRVNQALRERGLVTWFDSERMVGTMRQDMTNALGDTCCVLIFITKKYEEKVNSANEGDNCYFEFNVAAHDKNLANMRIPIVMEECMLNLESWQHRGRLKAEMGHKIYFDLSSDEEGVLEVQCDKIVERVVGLLKEMSPEVSFA